MKLKLLFIVLTLVLISGCTKTVNEITENNDFLDKTVSVKGTAQAPLKLGQLSGYTLIDENGDKIIVASKDLPEEGDKVTAKGTLKKGLLGIGFYIESK